MDGPYMFSVHRIMYTLPCTVYIVHCTMYMDIQVHVKFDNFQRIPFEVVLLYYNITSYIRGLYNNASILTHVLFNY